MRAPAPHGSPLPLAGLLLALASLTGFAAASETLVLSNQAFRDVTVKGADGTTQRRRVAAQKAAPGTEIIYVITYQNTGDQPARKVVVSNPVPKELVYKGGSAAVQGARAEVSVDGGRTFGPLSSLHVNGAGGVPRPARADDVTHLRWTLADPVAPGQKGSVSYRAVLK